jgi:hypothetical protein
MSDTVKKVAIPTLGGMTIAAWVLGVDPAITNTVFGLFVAATGLGIVGMVYNGMLTLFGAKK